MTAGIPVAGAQDTSDFEGRPEVERANERAVAAGEQVEERQFVDYFAAPQPERWYLPDGVQYFEFQELREGGKAAYEKATNKDIRVQRSTGDARLSVDPATQRQTLIRLSVTDVHLLQSDARGIAVPMVFNKDRPGKFWENLFTFFPAKLIDQLHQEITKANAWLAADDDVEALKEERERLDERIERAEEEQGKKALLAEQASDFVKGKSISNPHPALLIYGRLEAMKWSIPYSPGGLEDQSVMLLRSFDLINRVKGEHERQENKKREQEMKSKQQSKPRGKRR
ncbi:putative tail assembly protein [Gordonia phage GMA7]|uniref:Putative tail assembly protein n=1 Tax=Gordonia phage GMA7 TaxID=1647286 RepID=A0A0K0N6K7_9CAUD|nr:tail assembly chaperone [Gordonia phage GMA7]AKJ72455.1 putative tail assembly protein [Gordonia phage GMA7]